LLRPQEKFREFASIHQAIDEDLEIFWELLWHVIEPQAVVKKIDAAEFGKRMAADCIVSAQIAFIREWFDFFQKLQRPELAAALEKTNQIKERAIQKIRERLPAEMSRHDDRINAAIDKQLSESFSTLEADLASILDDSLGVTSPG
jgi:hypothetical protein